MQFGPVSVATDAGPVVSPMASRLCPLRNTEMPLLAGCSDASESSHVATVTQTSEATSVVTEPRPCSCRHWSCQWVMCLAMDGSRSPLGINQASSACLNLAEFFHESRPAVFAVCS